MNEYNATDVGDDGAMLRVHLTNCPRSPSVLMLARSLCPYLRKAPRPLGGRPRRLQRRRLFMTMCWCPKSDKSSHVQALISQTIAPRFHRGDITKRSFQRQIPTNQLLGINPNNDGSVKSCFKPQHKIVETL